MFLEILGTRIIGPFYGVSLFVWCSLISVTLIALASGYYLGGIVADKKSSLIPLYLITATAGTFIVIIPVIKATILTLTNPFGLRMGSLTCSFLLFFIPLTLLGMVGPCIIKLNTEQNREDRPDVRYRIRHQYNRQFYRDHNPWIFSTTNNRNTKYYLHFKLYPVYSFTKPYYKG